MVDDGPTAEVVLPTWWLAAIAAYGAFTSVSVVFDLVIFPDRIEELVGDAHKHAVLGALMSMRGCIHLSLPLVGTAVDRCYTPCGRRRPFLAFGCLCLVVGLWICKLAGRIETFSMGYAVYAVGCMVCWVPYCTVIPDLVPLGQRATASAWQTVMNATGSYAGLILAMWVGENKMSTGTAMTIAIAACAAAIPFGLLSLSAHPGLCVHELGARPATKGEEAAASASSRRRRMSRVVATLNPANLVGLVLDLFSALRNSHSYRFNWLSTFCGSFDVSGTFFLFWLQDTYGSRGFTVFGFTLAKSPQSALAKVSMLQSILSIVLSLPGGYLGDKFFGKGPGKIARRNLLLFSSFLGIWSYPVNILTPPFTFLFIFMMALNVKDGLVSPVSGAFSADCLPVAADGRPLSAAREQALMMYAGFLPMTFVPAVGGAIFNMMPRAEAYVAIYSWAFAVGMVRIFMFSRIPPNGCVDELEMKRDDAGRLSSQRRAEDCARELGWGQLPSRPPAGARLCDSLCFGAATAALSALMVKLETGETGEAPAVAGDKEVGTLALEPDDPDLDDPFHSA